MASANDWPYRGGQQFGSWAANEKTLHVDAGATAAGGVPSGVMVMPPEPAARLRATHLFPVGDMAHNTTGAR